MSPQPPRLLVLSQAHPHFFTRWLEQLSRSLGPLELWTGTVPSPPLPDVEVEPLTPYVRESNRSRLRCWLSATAHVALKLLTRRERPPLLVLTNPPFLPLLIGLLAPFLRLRYALLEWDIYPEAVSAMGFAGEKNPLLRIWRSLHGRALRGAELVITLGDGMADRLREAAGDDLAVEVIPVAADLERLRPLPRSENTLATELDLGDELVVLYSGNLGATHDLEALLAAMHELKDETGIRFVVAGEGSQRRLFEDAVTKGQLPQLSLLPFQPEARLPELLALADVGVVTLAARLSGISSPSKMPPLIAAGAALAVIAPASDDLSSLVVDADCGRSFRSDDAVGLAGWLRELAADRAKLHALRENARRLAEERYDERRCLERMAARIDETLLRQ
ncbi:MAG: glycosyltransferase family 4 protein [Acidobacteriota bacterium]